MSKCQQISLRLFKANFLVLNHPKWTTIFSEEQHGKGPRHYAADMDGIVFELYPLQEGEMQDHSRLVFLSNSATERSTLIDPDGCKIEITPSQKRT